MSSAVIKRIISYLIVRSNKLWPYIQYYGHTYSTMAIQYYGHTVQYYGHTYSTMAIQYSTMAIQYYGHTYSTMAIQYYGHTVQYYGHTYSTMAIHTVFEYELHVVQQTARQIRISTFTVGK